MKQAENTSIQGLQRIDKLPVNTLNLIKEVLQAEEDEIIHISMMKKGMTNSSYYFECKNKKYIIRIAGKGTENLIDRKQEYEVYNKIAALHLCDDIVYINPVNGCKITRYMDNARVCNAKDKRDVYRCMSELRAFHEQKIRVSFCFDIYEKINLYESLWNHRESFYDDYKKTKQKVCKLKEWVERQKKQWTLAHMDAVPDNFLFVENNGKEELRLIDWEYAGMQDACVDIAMFAVYAMYDREEVEFLINAYFPEGCTRQDRLKIYCYIASCGLLWSNWCEYKRQFGVEFGEYASRQYDYAKEYYEIFLSEIKMNG